MSKRRAALIALLAAALIFGALIGPTQAQEFGVNWSGTFFADPNFGGNPVPVSAINGLNFNFSDGIPVVNGIKPLGNRATNWSARFTSTQNFAGGRFTFNVTSDDGVRLIIDGQIVLDKFVGRDRTTDVVTQDLTAGPHNLTVEYFNGIGAAVLQVNWVLAGPSATAGPSPTPGPTNTPRPTGLPPIPSGSLTATVIRASVLNVRSAPSAFADRVGRILRGQTYQVVGRDPKARWFLLQLSGFRAWALGYYLYIDGNEFNAPVASTFVLQGNPASSSGIVAISKATLKLRRLPTIYSEQIGRVTWGGAVGVVGRTRAGDWWQVVWKGTVGWVVSGFLQITEGSIDKVPIVQP
jgi:uncharacterized protein YgiM (DUF1202 family)